VIQWDKLLAMGRSILVLLCLSLVSPYDLKSQSRVRDDWRYVGHGFDLEAHLTRSLRDAPLKEKDRQQIYRMIDDKTIHDSYAANERDEERRTVFSSRVGFVSLAEHDAYQMIVRGPQKFCGATGNCSIYIFVRHEGEWQLALETGGNTLIIEKSVSQGLHDIATYWHMNAAEGRIAVYRFKGRKYEQIDC
jgi:hypothetical protein